MTATAIIQNGFIPTFGMCKKFFDHLLAQCIYLCAKDAGVMFRPKNEPALRIFVSPRDSILAGSLLHLITSSAIARFYRGYIKCVFDVWRNPDSNQLFYHTTPRRSKRECSIEWFIENVWKSPIALLVQTKCWRKRKFFPAPGRK